MKGNILRNDAKAEMQHHVPKAALLRNFSFEKPNGKSRHVFLFDRRKGKLIPSQPSVNNVLGQRNFYSVKLGESIYSIEEGLTALEDAASPIISKIITNESLECLSDNDRAKLSTFITAQWLRSPKIRDSQKTFSETLATKSRRIAPEASNLSEIESHASEDGVKLSSIRLIEDLTGNLAEMVYSYRWLLHRATPQQSFWISDCPVVMYSQEDFGPYGSLGFGVPGIQLTMPLSSNFALSIWHPKVVHDLTKDYDERLKAFKHLKIKQALAPMTVSLEAEAFILETDKKFRSLDFLLENLDAGGAIPSSSENMDHFNSLQFNWSLRFIASRNDDFLLAARMFKDNPDGGVSFRMD